MSPVQPGKKWMQRYADIHGFDTYSGSPVHTRHPLNELVFLLSNDHDGAGRGAYHAFGCAADAEMFPASVPVGRHNDEIGSGLFGELNNFV